MLISPRGIQEEMVFSKYFTFPPAYGFPRYSASGGT
jgi:hypothetical protein